MLLSMMTPCHRTRWNQVPMHSVMLQTFQDQNRLRSEPVMAATRHVLSWHAAAAAEYRTAQ